ncbi:MAG TPA: ketopantoate reductase family protein [Streptosporangiaceae bacterium]|jgi:2-dehydropantoate 2-reductase
MRILVLGAGSTGGFFGARLAAAGRDVTFLVRPKRADQLRERGLRVLADGAEQTITPTLVTANNVHGPYDVVLVSVRSTALESALDDSATAVGPHTMVVPFLNGMSHLDMLTARFGTAVLGGVVKVATVLNDRGDIVRLGSFAGITVGELNGHPSVRLEQLRQELSGAGFQVDVSPSIVTAMWAKWAFITTLGGMTCLMRAPVGDIVAVPGGELLGPSLLAEGAAVAAAAGHPLPAAEVDAYTAMVTQPGSTLTASMYRDLVAGRPVEVEPVYGDLVARARDLGVPTPLLDLATLNLRIHQERLRRQPG